MDGDKVMSIAGVKVGLLPSSLSLPDMEQNGYETLLAWTSLVMQPHLQWARAH